MVQRIGLTAALALGLVGMGTAAQAVPSPERVIPAVVGCEDSGGDTFLVLNRGVVGFVLDDAGEPTGEKLFIVKIDAALFSDGGTLLGEFHHEYGNRTGHGEQIFCSGTIDDVPGANGFFDMVVTRR